MELIFQVKRSPEFVFQCLTNVSYFVYFHPVITTMQLQPDQSYAVHETLKVARIPVSFRYKAIIEATQPNSLVLIKATIARFNRIEMRFNLIPEANGVRVVEEVDFFSPLPINPILRMIFRKQHAIFFSNMEKLDMPVS